MFEVTSGIHVDPGVGESASCCSSSINDSPLSGSSISSDGELSLDACALGNDGDCVGCDDELSILNGWDGL